MLQDVHLDYTPSPTEPGKRMVQIQSPPSAGGSPEAPEGTHSTGSHVRPRSGGGDTSWSTEQVAEYLKGEGAEGCPAGEAA